MVIRKLTNLTVCTIHLGILVFWLAAWEKLFTTFGLIIWGAAALLGAGLFLLWKRRERIDNSDRLVALSTSILILLALLSALIEISVSSMP
ncbi:LPXTG cell wall anchor domain-containing protein [Terribacillus sp. DMT04]|uniref:LPXTG cell wall anchor domain-containing protein n=1 Tax=Terribacillus sp. DMT04 TaxID=2850441 RepID=UPI001C2B77A6|nr:LPXTG cell wall anchor domain-containing protein [Terribacillus sp. DMT04]QXE01657.1 LPXTG cell wall anchor domain-containing protein [Terribacillus sp. DMT04]